MQTIECLLHEWPKNRFELETDILSSALRQSLERKDLPGVRSAQLELSAIHPDLLSFDPKSVKAMKTNSYYELLNVKCDVNEQEVMTAFLKAIKTQLKANRIFRKQEYVELMNAGVVLRDRRLRMSHDMGLASNWLEQFEESEIHDKDAELHVVAFPCHKHQASRESGWERLPPLTYMLDRADLITPAQRQALLNQIDYFPDISEVDLILGNKYVSDLELKSIQLAEYLVTTGKISLACFLDLISYERDTGERLANSLQYDLCPPGYAQQRKKYQTELSKAKSKAAIVDSKLSDTSVKANTIVTTRSRRKKGPRLDNLLKLVPPTKSSNEPTDPEP